MTDRTGCMDRSGTGRALSIGLALAMMAGTATAQSPADLVRTCAQAVQAGLPPSFVGLEPYGSEGEPGEAYVVRAWDNIPSVPYFEFQSLENIYDDADRIAHECRFQLHGDESGLRPVLAEMAAVLAEIGPATPLEIDETFPHAAFACRADGLPLTLTVKRNSDGVFWVEAWDTTWDLAGC